MDTYFILIFCIIFGFILIVPFVVGVIFISDKNNNSYRLRKLAGWFIFKPIITTPIWILVVLYSNYLFISQPSIFWSLISITPAIIATIIIVYKFRDLFYLKKSVAWLLLGVDIVRWGSTFIAMNTPFYNSGLSTITYLISGIFPTLYTIIAAAFVSSAKISNKEV